MYLKHYTLSSQSGVVLIAALLYLSIISLFLISAFSAGLLQIKLATHFMQEIQAFEQAEGALLAGENFLKNLSIQERLMAETGKNTANSYEFLKITRPECGLFFQINSMGTQQAAMVQLSSIMVFPDEGPSACINTKILPHRIIWYENKS